MAHDQDANSILDDSKEEMVWKLDEVHAPQTALSDGVRLR